MARKDSGTRGPRNGDLLDWVESTVFTLGPFELNERIGKGGQAEVWAGVHGDQQTPVAVKVITRTDQPNTALREAVRNEARAMAGLDHQNILMLFDAGEVTHDEERASERQLKQGSPYLVMELADGGSVAPLAGALSWRKLVRIVLAVLDALAHAHGRGVLHRDVKPSNVLRCGDEVKLSDFGVALRMEPDESAVQRAARIQGTPAYMAPEQFTGQWKDFGPPTDLYALGCLAHTLSCGHPPFGRRGEFETMYSLHAEAELAPVVTEMPVPAGFDTWLRRLLEKRPSRRYQRAADAALALLALGEPTDEARAPGPARWDDNPISGLRTLTCFTTIQSGTAASAIAAPDTDPGLSTDPEINLVPDFPLSWQEAERPHRAMRMLGAGLGLHGLRAMPMVGRVDERDELWSALATVTSERSAQLVLLEGSAGCGKTRLAEWLCERAHELGAATVLKATHSPRAGPGHGLAPMLARHLRTAGLGRRELSKHVRDVLAEQGVVDDDEREALVELLAPTTGQDAVATPVVQFASAQERYVLIARLIERLCRRRPVIVWLEDVQWGLDALGLAEHLIQRGQDGMPVLLLLTARDEALAEQREAERLIHECTRRRGARRLPVPPMPKARWPQLLEELLRLEPALAARVAAHTHGNPLFAVHMVADWLDRGLLQASPAGFRVKEDQTIDLPNELHQIWRARIEHLLEGRPAEDAAALELAAVLGQEIDGREWLDACSVAGVVPTPSLVDQLLARRLAVTGQRGPREGWSFVHGMLRDGLEHRSEEAGRARQHHDACARMLRTRRGPGILERLGHHLLAAGKPEQAFAPLRHGARERLYRGEYGQANALLTKLEAALTAVKRPPRDPRWGQSWLLRARVAMQRGRHDDGLRWAAQTEHQARQHGWLSLLTEALLLKGMIRRTQGFTARAEHNMCLARDMARELGDDRLLAEVLEALGRLLMHKGELHDAETCWHEARELFRGSGDAKGAASALWSLAHVATYMKQYDLAARYNDSALGELDRVGDRWGVGRCLNTAGEIARLRGALDAAERHYRRAAAIMKALGAEDSAAICAANIARVLVDRGEFRTARARLEQYARDLEEHGRLDALAWIHTALLTCCAADQDWQAWTHNWHNARFLLTESNYRDLDIAQSAQLAGDLAASAGRLDEARQAYRLSLEQWKALGRSQDAAEVKGRLQALRGPSSRK